MSWNYYFPLLNNLTQLLVATSHSRPREGRRGKPYGNIHCWEILSANTLMSARNARESRSNSWGRNEVDGGHDIEEIQSVINESDSDEGSGIRFTNDDKHVTGLAKKSQPLQSQMMWPTYEEDEDEDSDGAGHPEYIPPKRKKKRATRMRSAERHKTRMAKTRRSPAREDRTDSSSGGRPSNSPTRTGAAHGGTPQRRDSSSAFVSSVGTRSDLESSYSDQSPNRSYDEVEDATFGFGKDDKSRGGMFFTLISLSSVIASILIRISVTLLLQYIGGR